ncbi:MAG: hypothetical protein ABIJ18_04755 [archaeon]
MKKYTITAIIVIALIGIILLVLFKPDAIQKPEDIKPLEQMLQLKQELESKKIIFETEKTEEDFKDEYCSEIDFTNEFLP